MHRQGAIIIHRIGILDREAADQDRILVNVTNPNNVDDQVMDFLRSKDPSLNNTIRKVAVYYPPKAATKLMPSVSLTWEGNDLAKLLAIAFKEHVPEMRSD